MKWKRNKQKQQRKLNKTKPVLFFKIISKIDKPLPRLTQKLKNKDINYQYQK